MNKLAKTTQVLATGLTIIGMLAGCTQATSAPQGFSISSQQLDAVMKTPKVPSFAVEGSLKEIAEFGTQTKGPLPWEHVLGTVEDILPPVTVNIEGQETPGMWVPVVVRVQQASPALNETSVTLRVYPYSEHAPDLTQLSKGELILAVGTGPYTDQTGIEAVSLGWLLDVSADGSVKDLYAGHQLTGNFNDVADLLNMSKIG